MAKPNQERYGLHPSILACLKLEFIDDKIATNPATKKGNIQSFFIKILFSLICEDIKDSNMNKAAMFGADNIKKIPIFNNLQLLNYKYNSKIF